MTEKELSLYLKTKDLLKRIEWVNLIFLVSAHLVALIGGWVLFTIEGLHPYTLILSLFMMVICGVAITGGYHRLFAHRSYKANWFLKSLFLIFGAAAFQNSARRWGSDHRRHHKYVDTVKDPYNIKEGFLFAHIGWIVLKYDQSEQSYNDVPDLMDDPLVRFQEKYYVPLAIAFGFLFPTLIASLWGDPLGGFIWAGWVRIVLNEHFTFSINSFSHMFGAQPYSDADTSRDNWFFALFTYGEGYHNFHHRFPFDYRNAIRAHQWDPTKWLIRVLSYFGVTRDLKQAPKEAILQARLKMDEKRLLERLERPHRLTIPISRELVAATRVKIEHAYSHFQALKKEYARLKKEKIEALNVHIHSFNERLEHLKQELAKARAALEEAMAAWVELCSGLGVHPSVAAV